MTALLKDIKKSLNENEMQARTYCDQISPKLKHGLEFSHDGLCVVGPCRNGDECR